MEGTFTADPTADMGSVTATLIRSLARRRAAHSLPSMLYTDPSVLRLEFEHLWQREWVFAGHECEVAAPGQFLTVTVGAVPLLVLRGEDGELRALHNVCRHRGFVLCESQTGSTKRRLVCPYHQWSYRLDGTLAKARSMPESFDTASHGLGLAHCRTVAGLIFVCAAPDPPDFSPIQATLQLYLGPFDLVNARVAHSSTIIEHGNWKLVMENNRECYHCRIAHPELCVTFPEAPLHSGGGDATELLRLETFVTECEDLGLPSRFAIAGDHQYRAMRMPFVGDARSMTHDGTPAVSCRFGALPERNIGDVLAYHYPSMWSHFMADHALTFRMLPITATTTELRTTWLVPADAIEGVDYHLARLTEVWLATNAQDRALVERTQRGVSSPAYRPGPYAPKEEEGVIQFVDWYSATMRQRLEGPARQNGA